MIVNRKWAMAAVLSWAAAGSLQWSEVQLRWMSGALYVDAELFLGGGA